jgi:hypothetical protein
MDKTTFTVYWMYKALVPNALQFTDMGKALAWMADLRKRADAEQISAITMCSEMTAHVGKVGVDSVVDGKTPDGHVYDWNKDSRIGKMKRSERIKPPIGTETVIVKLDEEQ